MLSYFILFHVFAGCFSYKFLVYNPLYGHSHISFLSKIADTLAEAGHEVTVLFPIVDETLENKTSIKSGAKQIFLKQDSRLLVIMKEVREIVKNKWTANPSQWSLLRMVGKSSLLNGVLCETVASNSNLIEQLRSEKFDVGIAEPLSICGFGLFDHLQIPSTIGALSCTQSAPVSWYLGEPLATSYVPSMISIDGDQMGFFARIKNSFTFLIECLYIGRKFNKEAGVLTRIWGKDYSSDYGDLIGRTSFMFTNSNPIMNYPRPLLHKTVEIGGITVDVEKDGELGEKWNRILNQRNHTVLILFGSMLKSKDIPKEWKNSFISLFASKPDVTFIWKYEEATKMAENLTNVNFDSWLPQKALLADPRLSLFITHGGLGSTNEAAYFGKPSILIPLFGDQMRNAAMLTRHGGALILQKNNLGNAEKLHEAVTRILTDPSFANNATKRAKMLKEQPVSAKELVISHAEFVAKFGPLKQTDPYGRKLNLFQYYLIDVLVFVLLFLLILMVISIKIARIVLRPICDFMKSKGKLYVRILFEHTHKKLE